MDIKILGTESLGVRGLSCLVTCKKRKILIDPGIALGYMRHGLLPHPFQIALGAVIRGHILDALGKADTIVFSHFHGDHVPLAGANPFQLSLDSAARAMKTKDIFGPGADGLPGVMLQRRMDMEQAFECEIVNPANQRFGPLSFSSLMPHGLPGSTQGSVLMTRITDGETVFIHASDIQLLNTEAVSQILDWRPDIVLASGPPIYLESFGKDEDLSAVDNAQKLAREVSVVILDHHLLRCRRGLDWIKSVRKSSPNRVLCAAEFMGRKPCMPEAWRRELYAELPVPAGWHEAYAQGLADPKGFTKWRDWDLENIYADQRHCG